MNEKQNSPELDAKLAAFLADQKEWLKKARRVAESIEPGVWSAPQNQKQLNQMNADLAKSAAEDKEGEKEEDQKNG